MSKRRHRPIPKCDQCGAENTHDVKLLTLCVGCTEPSTLEEGNRQTILLALAELSLRRPGWCDHLGRIADSFDGRDMFDGFRETSADLVSESPSKPILRSEEDIERYNRTGIDL